MSLLQRLMDKAIPEPNSGCWLWTASNDGSWGYGVVTVGSRTDGTRRHEKAHRLSYELHYGAIPAGMRVLHKCDVPACINPLHLFLGTDADNAADKARKGRAAKKLTAEKVVRIREMATAGMRHADIGKQFGVEQTSVSAIVRRDFWRHV